MKVNTRKRLRQGKATVPNPWRVISRMAGSLSVLFSTGPRWRQPEDLCRLLRRLIVMRVVILSALLGMTVWEALSRGMSAHRASLVAWLFGVTYAVSLLSALLLRVSKRPLLQGYFQLGIDVVLATLAIYVTEAPVSISLYLLVIIGAAAVFGRNGAVLVGALAGLCYAVLTSGLLPPLSPDARTSSSLDIFVVYISLVAIASVSGYLAHQLEILGTLADRNAKRVDQLNQEQQRLFDDISEGIITLDLDTAITSINQAARSIMGLSQLDAEAFIGAHLPSVFTRYGIAGGEGLLECLSTDEAPAEVRLRGPDDGSIHLNCSVREITDAEGHPAGKIILFSDISQVRTMEERLSLHERMAQLLADGDDPVTSPALSYENVQMVGESQIMHSVLILVERVAMGSVSVLIVGESGTGKELIAKAIHTRSGRRNHPFVAINCGAIPENLMESELFGHKKGAFTGAINDNPGLFRRAHGGTVFLDEVGELPVHLQTKLLRALQEKMVRAVGDVRDIPVDVRVLAATNRDLKKEITLGNFREDLFYRLNVVNILVPPLRERRDDIPLLVRHFIGRFCPKDQLLAQISPEALQLLMSYSFPGNVRELENIIERALVLGGKAILPKHLPDEVLTRKSRDSLSGNHCSNGNGAAMRVLPIQLEEEIEKLERMYLEEALRQADGIKKQAAELLGLNFRSFRYRLKKYGLGESAGSE